jgi:polysaccharide pyruvyl transferase WcaK-like protein
MIADRSVRQATRRSGRLLMIGNYGNGNIGDDAILIQVAPKALQRGTVTVLSRNPERISSLVPEIDSASMVSARALVEFLRADTVVIGGGGMFGRGIPPLVACLPFVLLVAQVLGKDVELFSVGAYPDMPTLVAWALRRVVRRARHVSARDLASVEALGGPGHATLVRDPAWELEPAGREAVSAALSAAGVRADRPMIAVSLKPGAGADTDHRCLSRVAEGLDRWAEGNDCQILFLSFSDKGDYQLGHDVTDLDLGRSMRRIMVNGRCVRFVGPDLHPAVMLGVVRCCRGVVAMRLHAQIFAMAVDRPVYGLSFEAKCDEFLASVGVSVVRPDAVSVDDLGRWLERVAPPQRIH